MDIPARSGGTVLEEGAWLGCVEPRDTLTQTTDNSANAGSNTPNNTINQQR